MSLSDAERYARRARNSNTAEEVGDATRRAIDALITEIKRLQQRVSYLESRLR